MSKSKTRLAYEDIYADHRRGLKIAALVIATAAAMVGLFFIAVILCGGAK